MNCKPGDLAIVTKASRESNIGKIVRVIGVYSHEENGIAWEVECETVVEVVGCRSLRPKSRNPKNPLIAWDAWLRPITGLPIDEETREELTA